MNGSLHFTCYSLGPQNVIINILLELLFHYFDLNLTPVHFVESELFLWTLLTYPLQEKGNALFFGVSNLQTNL